MLVTRFVRVLPLDPEFRPSRVEAAKSCLLMAVFATCYCFSLYRLLMNKRLFRNNIQRRLQSAELGVLGMCVVSCFSLYLKKGESYHRTVEGVKAADTELSRRGQVVSYDSLPVVLSNCFVLLYVALLLTPMFWMSVSPCGHWESPIELTVMSVSVILAHCLGCPFCSCLSALKCQFGQLGRALVSLKTSGAPVVCAEDVERVERLADIHGTLCDVAYELNAAMGIQLLTIAFYINAEVVTSLYLIVINVSAAHDLCSICYLICVTLWLIIWVYELFYIVALCASTVKQSKEFNTALFELMMEDQTNELARNEKLQLHVTIRREAYFSACRLFPVDYSLIHSMAAAATTYLVILVQFDQSPVTPQIRNAQNKPRATCCEMAPQQASVSTSVEAVQSTYRRCDICSIIEFLTFLQLAEMYGPEIDDDLKCLIKLKRQHQNRNIIRMKGVNEVRTFFEYSLLLPSLLGAIPYNGALEKRWWYSSATYVTLFIVMAYSIVYLDPAYYKKRLHMLLDAGECLVVVAMALASRAGCSRARLVLTEVLGQHWLGGRVTFWNCIYRNLLGLALFCLTSLLYLRAFPANNVADLSYVVCLTVSYLYVNMATTVFHACSRLLEAHLASLRLFLRVPPPDTRTLEGLAARHSLLCRISDRLGLAFSFPFLVTTAGVFVVSVSNIFLLVQKSDLNSIKRGRWPSEDKVLLVVWVLVWLIEEVCLVRSCASVQRQSKEFNTALFHMMMEDQSNELARNFGYQLFYTLFQYASLHLKMPILHRLLHFLTSFPPKDSFSTLTMGLGRGFTTQNEEINDRTNLAAAVGGAYVVDELTDAVRNPLHVGKASATDQDEERGSVLSLRPLPGGPLAYTLYDSCRDHVPSHSGTVRPDEFSDITYKLT
ncbi:hypothetical protein AAG570_013374 [Ranatra chinensis]|uniref:Gustatory receptor n=1 Tax=Ranatra chinensis TaxID=642074 RepID=A0ABD0YC00_9HEMI